FFALSLFPFLSLQRAQKNARWSSPLRARLPAFPSVFRRDHLPGLVPPALGLRLSGCLPAPRQGNVAVSDGLALFPNRFLPHPLFRRSSDVHRVSAAASGGCIYFAP